MAEHGRPALILLNGTPSSGKSTIARALQRRTSPRLLAASVDDFIAMHPDRSQLATLQDASGGGMRLDLTAAGRSLMSGFHRAVVALADAARKRESAIVVDDLFLDRALVADWLRATASLGDAAVLLVGVHCPLEECERRERTRGDRTPGLARGYAREAHRDVAYDVEVDTGDLSAEACADRIATRWLDGPAPSAFAALRARFAAG